VKRRFKTYAGKLAEPLKTEPLGGLEQWHLYETGQFRALDRYFREERKNLDRLLKHYEIKKWKPDRWYQLALALARDHVIGFRRRAKAGAKQKWDQDTVAALRRAVKNLRSSPSMSIASACRVLANREPWKSIAGNKSPSEALRRAYYGRSVRKP
jgi:hypothetical protein